MEKVYYEMRQKRIAPSATLCNLMLRAYRKKRLVNRIRNFVNGMPQLPESEKPLIETLQKIEKAYGISSNGKIIRERHPAIESMNEERIKEYYEAFKE
jgi:hypothetical protein